LKPARENTLCMPPWKKFTCNKLNRKYPVHVSVEKGSLKVQYQRKYSSNIDRRFETCQRKYPVHASVEKIHLQ